MADLYGGTALPLPVPDGKSPIGDPVIYYLGLYLQAVGNAKCGAAWRKLDPRADAGPIESVFYEDPTDPVGIPVDDNSLPALFIHRGDVDRWIQLAEDIRISRGWIHVHWVAPEAAAEDRRDQQPFWHALFDEFDIAINEGRDPSWIVPGDDYSGASASIDGATPRGSVLAYWAPFRRIWPEMSGRRPLQQQPQQPSDPKPPLLCAYEMRLIVEEQYSRDVATRYAVLGGVVGSTKTDPTDPLGSTTLDPYTFT